jgi:ATP-dependent protease Clp ATPase subunit
MKCSFCGKDDTDAAKLIAAGDNIAICDSCVFTCMNILVYGEPEPSVINLDEETTKEDEDAQKDVGC